MIFYILLSYFFGILFLYETFKKEKLLIGMDILMLILSPLTILTIAIVKMSSHIFDLEKVVMTYEEDI